MTVRQDDSVMLTVFVVNGDHHEVELTDPDGEQIIANAAWDRGHEYTAFFQTRKVGTYLLECAVHRPSMEQRSWRFPR
jgi:plastocyanin